jgi:hypothetical protein
MSKEMVRILPAGSCPICGHNQFIVAESELNVFLTDRDGYVIDSKEYGYNCEGVCCNCKNKFEMIASPERFIPLTPLRKLLYENTHHYELAQREGPVSIKNPMEVN